MQITLKPQPPADRQAATLAQLKAVQQFATAAKVKEWLRAVEGIAKNPQTPAGLRLEAYRILLDRALGQARQPVEYSGKVKVQLVNVPEGAK